MTGRSILEARPNAGARVFAAAAMTLAVATMLLFCHTEGTSAAPRPVIAPANPAYLRAIENADVPMLDRGDGQTPTLGCLPDPVLTQRNSRAEQAILDDLPAAYDLRDHDKLTPVKDQGPLGTCWTFATMGALESFLMPRAPKNFSEDNLVNCSGYTSTDNYDAGGNYAMALAYLLRQAGPKYE